MFGIRGRIQGSLSLCFGFCLALAFMENAGNSLMYAWDGGVLRAGNPFNVYVWGIVLVGANGYVKFNVRNKKIGDKRPLFIKDF